MRRASPRILSLGLRLLGTAHRGQETAGATSGGALQERCEALRLRLAQLIGREGYRALLSRALALAEDEHPWLHGVQADAAGSLTGVAEALEGQEPAQPEAGAAAVLVHVMELLVAFVGPELTRQLVSSAWPDVHVLAADLATEEGEA
jgi:hypothetical protein